MLNKNSLTVALLFFIAFLSRSPIIRNTVGVTGNYFMILASLLLIILNFRKLNIWVLLFVILIFTISSFLALYFVTPKYILVPIYFCLSTVIIFLIEKTIIKQFIKFSSNIFIFLLIGAIIGFIYAFFGGEPLLYINNEDGMKNSLFLTTFSNTIGWINIIRPSGIYDEPGAFSFYICSLVMLREIFGFSKRLSLVMLIIGMVTLSLAHFIFLIFYSLYLFINKLRSFKKFNYNFAINYKNFGVALLIISIIIPSYELLSDKVISRLVFKSGGFVGDNRTDRMLNTLSLINEESFFFGIGPGGVIKGVPFDRKKIGFFGENPFTLLAGYGIILSFPYYLAIISLLVNGLRHKKFLIFFSFILLILQRPNLFSFGYTFIIITILYYSFYIKEIKFIKFSSN